MEVPRFFKKIAIISLLGLSFMLFIPFTHAQSTALTITLSPKYPKPFQTVTVSIEDFSRDLNRTEISWAVNDTIEERGMGIKKHQFKTGALGTATNLSVNIGGETQQLTIRPTIVDLMWQADSYVPPFYGGKALHSNQDPIVIVAEPFFYTNSTTKLDPTKLVYTWKQNGKVNPGSSGYGKKSFQIVPSVLIKPIDVEVDVSSVDNQFRSTALITIPDSKPEVVFYENNPLYGIAFENALNNKETTIKDQEVNILGVPFFFSKNEQNSNLLKNSWALNNSVINQNDNEVVFRKPDNTTQGKSLISLEIKNPVKFVQSATSNFYLSFQNDSSSNTNSRSIF